MRVILGKGNKVTIGDRIRRIRKKRRLTQAELAMMSGLSLSAIQGYEQGRYEPKRKSLESIAEVFKIPVDELYDMPTQLGTNLAEVGRDAISRQQAIDAVMECYDNDELFEVYEWKLNELQPIQPKRGKWIKISPANIYECSECGKSVMTNDICTYDFCHGCGADMRQKGENNESN